MAELYINYGKDLSGMAVELLEKADIAAKLHPSMRICIKPNLVVAKPAEGGATTHPEIVEGIILYLQRHGMRDISVSEGAWIGESTHSAFRVCGYTRIAERYGVKLVDTKCDAAVTRKFEGMELRVCESVMRADYLINVPVLKGHCQTSMTCCLKNLKGCIPDAEKRRYHTMGLHKPIAALNAVLKPALHIVDGVCGDLTFEEGGNPVESGRILMGCDPVLVDSYCAQLMGYQPDEIGYLRYAREYGVGNYADEDVQVVELNAGRKPKAAPPKRGEVRELAGHIEERSACSACYAALIFALNKAGPRGLKSKIKIGQGYRGMKVPGMGVGNCAAGCERYAPGCPPTALEIVDFLRSVSDS